MPAGETEAGRVTRIVVADDHLMVRLGLRAVLEAEPDMRVVGEAPDGLKAAALAADLKPDVLVVDLLTSAMNGLEVTRYTREHSPDTQIVVLSAYEGQAYALEAFRAGATGYALKDAEAGEVVRVVRSAAAGRRAISAPLEIPALDAPARAPGLLPPQGDLREEGGG